MIFAIATTISFLSLNFNSNIFVKLKTCNNDSTLKNLCNHNCNGQKRSFWEFWFECFRLAIRGLPVISKGMVIPMSSRTVGETSASDFALICKRVWPTVPFFGETIGSLLEFLLCVSLSVISFLPVLLWHGSNPAEGSAAINKGTSPRPMPSPPPAAASPFSSSCLANADVMTCWGM